MGWHEAYPAQARSDYAMFRSLGMQNANHCHQLHYLQMASEKMAKAMLTAPGDDKPAPSSHVMFVRMLQVLKGRPEVRRQLGYSDVKVFKAYIDSLLDLATRIEQLSPDQAGLTRPNAEYPWEDQSSRQVLAPVEYSFPEFNPRDPKMAKIDRLIGDLLRIAR